MLDPRRHGSTTCAKSQSRTESSLASGKIFLGIWRHPAGVRARIRQHPAKLETCIRQRPTNEMCTRLTCANNIFFPLVLFPAPQHAAPPSFRGEPMCRGSGIGRQARLRWLSRWRTEGWACIRRHPAKGEADIRRHPACRMLVESLVKECRSSPVVPRTALQLPRLHISAVVDVLPLGRGMWERCVAATHSFGGTFGRGSNWRVSRNSSARRACGAGASPCCLAARVTTAVQQPLVLPCGGGFWCCHGAARGCCL